MPVFQFFQFENLPPPIIRHLNGLWRRRWVVAAAAWLAALAGWFGVWLIPDQYESRAQVYVQTETILQPVLTGVTAQPDYSNRVEVMRLQLLTRPNVQEIIYRAGLDKLIETSNPVERQARMQGLVDWVSGKIRITSPREMYFVISYQNGDPEVAKRVTDAVLNLLIEQDLGASLSENQAARRRLDLQIEEFEEKLSANEQAVAAFRRQHASELATTEGADRRRDQKENELARTTDELAKTRGRILTLQNLVSATPRSATGGELERLKVELAELRSKYRESHPDIRGVEARITELERDDGSALSSNPEYIRLQSELRVARDSIATLQARQAILEDELNALDIAVGQVPAIMADLQQIERQYDTTKKTYEDLLERRDRLQLTESLGPSGQGVEYQVFERPERSINPSSPSRAMLIYAVIILAMGAGVAVGLILNLLDKSYSQMSDLEEAFGLPVLGAFTEAPSVAVRHQRQRDVMGLAGAALGIVLLGVLYTYLSVSRFPTDVAQEARFINSENEVASWA